MDIDTLRADIPALSDGRYCNWGASGPSPQRVVKGATSTIEYHEYVSPMEEGMYAAAFDVFEDARAGIADFVGASPNEIALTQSTTDGINRIANALRWSADDEVVITDVEHSAGRLPWYRLERDYGITVTVLETDRGWIDPDELASAAADATLVSFSAIDWIYGRRHPVSELVSIVDEAGALSLIDAVQVPGQQEMDVTEWGADYVAAAGHKWLLGPWGAGFVYVDETAADQLQPVDVGYRTVEDPMATDFTYEAGARRLELGTVSPAPYAGLQTAMETIANIGVDRIEDRIRGLTESLKDGLPSDRLRSPESFHSGLVAVADPSPDETVAALAEAGIRIRALPIPETVRVSLHAVNTESDVEALVEALRE